MEWNFGNSRWEVDVMSTIRTTLLAVAAAACALAANVAGAAPVACAALASVDTTPDSKCWDHYGPANPNNIPPGTITYDYGTLDPTPAGAGLTTTNVLQLPTGYSLLDKTPGSFSTIGDPLSPTYAGSFSLNQTTGAFTIAATSSQPFILFIKQADYWVSFLLGSNTGFLDTDLTKDGIQGAISHYGLFGVGDGERLVPIPAAAWLLGSGLIGLFAVGRRRKAGQVVAA
jgi:hypothetical protein